MKDPRYLGFILGLLSLTQAAQAVTLPKPNIVLLFVDDLGWADLGYRNPDKWETPHIDQLARDGVDFQQCYIACPTCSPSRGTLITGKHPARLKLVRHIQGHEGKNVKLIYDEEGLGEYHLLASDPCQFPSKERLELDELTYAEAMKPLGYTSMLLGKWHLGADHEFGPVHQGFDQLFGITDYSLPSPYDRNFIQPTAFPTLEERDVYLKAKVDGRDLTTVAHKDIRNPFLVGHLTDAAVDFIDTYDNPNPFMLSFWYYDVHGPHVGTQQYVDHFLKKGLPRKEAEYGAMLKSVDDSVGRVRAALTRNGLAQNTIVMLLSDQGGAFDNSPFRGGKYAETLYEGGARVPFLVSWPGVTQPGSTNNSIVQSTDVFPTLIEWAGGDPAEYNDLDGLSLVETIRQNSELKRVAPMYGYRAYGDLYASVREGDWKLLAYRSGVLKLYNIALDMGEENDVAAQYSEKVAVLKAKLVTWEKEMGVEQYSGVQ